MPFYDVILKLLPKYFLKRGKLKKLDDKLPKIFDINYIF